MIDSAYRELLTTIAEAAAALTGLLFVAISVAPGRRSAAEHTAVKQVRAAASLLTFTNALSVSLFGLVPGDNIGWPATVVSVGGLFFVAASIRTLAATPAMHSARRGQVALMLLLLLLFGSELFGGIALLISPYRHWLLDLLGNVLVGSMLIGVGRAWDLVGDRDTGIVYSLGVLTGRRPAAPPGTETPLTTEAPPSSEVPRTPAGE